LALVRANRVSRRRARAGQLRSPPQRPHRRPHRSIAQHRPGAVALDTERRGGR
jgi:hypothetical protein